MVMGGHRQDLRQKETGTINTAPLEGSTGRVSKMASQGTSWRTLCSFENEVPFPNLALF